MILRVEVWDLMEWLLMVVVIETIVLNISIMVLSSSRKMEVSGESTD